MDEALRFIDRYQAWIYLLLLLAAVLYGQAALRWFSELRRSLFGLEREQSMARLRRSAFFLGLSAASALAVFLITTFITPGLPDPAPAALFPTMALAEEPASAGTAVAPAAAGEVDSSGCANPDATIRTPEFGETLTGVVAVRGTASITDFGFYKLEYRTLAADSAWRAIMAGDAPMVDGLLHEWDTSLVLPGDYELRLVVADTAGNAPLPCTLRIRVAPSP